MSSELRMGTDRAATPVDSWGYGTSEELCRLLDGVNVLLREEPQEHWDKDADLRLASEAVADHLYHRLRLEPAAVTDRDPCKRRGW